MRRVLIAAASLLGALPVAAQAGGCQGQQVRLAPFAHESLTVSTAAVSLTAATYAPTGATAAAYAYITVETDSVRWWADGTAPTSSVGHAQAAATSFSLCDIAALSGLRVIRSGASDATLRVSYFRAAQ